jgi:uncharacterized protein (TIGR03066 family)
LLENVGAIVWDWRPILPLLAAQSVKKMPPTVRVRNGSIHKGEDSMRIMCLALAAIAYALPASTSAADDYKKLLVGKWEVVKADKDTIMVGTTVQFQADGKMKMATKEGKEISGTYTVEGKVFTLTLDPGGGKTFERKITIKKLTESEFETTNEEGKSASLKKVK